MSGYAGRKNAYTCRGCGTTIVTIDLVDGTTPASMRCRATAGCKGTMWSLWYPDPFPEGLPEPTFEWYAPHRKERRKLTGHARQHVKMGGLLIRPVAP